MSADQQPPENPTQECEDVLAGLADLWDALEEGDTEAALEMGYELVREFPESGNAQLGLAAVLYEVGAVQPCMESVERAGELGVNDPPLQQWYLAACAHYLWNFPAARDILEEVLRDHPDFGEAWYLLAQVCEMQSDEIGARRGFESAFRQEPDRFPRPHRVDDEALERAVGAAREALPPAYQEVLDQAALIVEDLPRPELAEPQGENGVPLPPDILGLFIGSNPLERSVFDPGEEPPKIYLFRRNLGRVCPNKEILAEEVRTTIWHELAHALGFDEEQVADLGLE
jgi:predicted Zn-dependent protease with MMP-like domain